MIYEMPKCGGCQTCEIACSFHHTGEFNVSVSSIRILEKDDGSGYVVSLAEKDRGRAKACDGCPGRKVPFCVEYCKEDKELKEMIEDMLAERAEKE